MNEIPVMLKVKQVSEKYNFSEYFVRNLIAQRKIVFVKSGSRFLVNEQSLIRFLNCGDADDSVG